MNHRYRVCMFALLAWACMGTGWTQEAPLTEHATPPVAEMQTESMPAPDMASAPGTTGAEALVDPATVEPVPPVLAQVSAASPPATDMVDASSASAAASEATQGHEREFNFTALWLLAGHAFFTMCYSPYLRYVVKRNRACVFFSAGEKRSLAALGILSLLVLLYSLLSGLPVMIGFLCGLGLSIYLARRACLRHALGQPQPVQVAIGKALLAPWTVIGPLLAFVFAGMQSDKAYDAANRGHYGDAARHGASAAGALAVGAVMSKAFDTYLVNGPFWYESHGEPYPD